MNSVLLALVVFFGFLFILKKFTKAESKFNYDYLIKVLFIIVVLEGLKSIAFHNTFSRIFEPNSIMDLGSVFLLFSSLFLIGLLRFNYYPSKRLQLSQLELIIWIVNFYVYEYLSYSCFSPGLWEQFFVYISALFLRLYIISKLNPSFNILKIGLLICGLLLVKHFVFNPPLNDYVQNYIMENERQDFKNEIKGYWEGEAIYIIKKEKEKIRIDTINGNVFRVELGSDFESDSIRIQAKLRIDDSYFYFRNTGKLKPRYSYSNYIYEPLSWNLRDDENKGMQLFFIDVSKDSIVFTIDKYYGDEYFYGQGAEYVFKLYRK